MFCSQNKTEITGFGAKSYRRRARFLRYLVRVAVCTASSFTFIFRFYFRCYCIVCDCSCCMNDDASYDITHQQYRLVVQHVYRSNQNAKVIVWLSFVMYAMCKMHDCNEG